MVQYRLIGGEQSRKIHTFGDSCSTDINSVGSNRTISISTSDGQGSNGDEMTLTPNGDEVCYPGGSCRIIHVDTACKKDTDPPICISGRPLRGPSRP